MTDPTIPHGIPKSGIPQPGHALSNSPHVSPRPDGDTRQHVVVVGAGLAGLTSAVTAARLGARVTLLDARSEIGGRARSHPAAEGSDALFNEGPHALYAGGEARSTLAGLGINPTGGKPPVPVWIEHNGRLEVLPTRARDALRRPTVKLSATTALGRILMIGGGAEPGPTQSMADWIEAATGNADVRALLRMLTRVATYCDDFEAISATVAVRQVRAAARTGVLYIDGGWQSMVDGLRQAATDAGVEIRTGCKATAISGVGSDTGLTVAIAGTSSESAAATQPTKAAKAERTAGIPADAVVVSSGGPATANDLLAAGGNASAELHTSASQAVPVRATTLDVHLSELPRPDMRVCFPTGEPLYLSVHTPSANLARTGEVMHLLWYGEHDDSVRNRMEALAERVQPCWREHVLAERFGRSLVVAHDRPTGHDTTAVEVADSPGVFVAGDWVFPTPEVLLADAAVLSGRRAGEAAAATAATPGTSTKGAQRAPIG